MLVPTHRMCTCDHNLSFDAPAAQTEMLLRVIDGRRIYTITNYFTNYYYDLLGIVPYGIKVKRMRYSIYDYFLLVTRY